MEIRELVRLKRGVGGLEPPENVAVLLDRSREGGETMARVFTLKGPMRIRWSNILEGTGIIYDGPKEDLHAMARLLNEASSRERAAQTLRMDPQQIADSKTPKDLWTTLWTHLDTHPEEGTVLSGAAGPGLFGRSFPPEFIGSIHFAPKLLSPKQVQAVAKVLSECDDPHSPYFVKVPTRTGANYVPYTREAMRSVMDDIAALRLLRSRLVLEEGTGQEHDDRGRHVNVRALLHDDLSDLPLSEVDLALLRRVCAWGVHYLENSTWPDRSSDLRWTPLARATPFGLGGTNVRTLDGFDLERFVRYLFMDLARSRVEDPASNIIKVLLEMCLLTWKDASGAVVDHKLASGARRFHREFSRYVMEASSRMERTISNKDREGRTDLTDLETYTIDPIDAKDFDDAISLERTSKGEHVLWVHIADVSHYVRPGDLVDAEARFRATSVYLPTGVLPMLPPVLSEDLCSLKAGTERLALSTKVVLGPDLGLRSFEHCLGIIKVKENLDYERVEGYIRDGVEPFSTLDRIASGLAERNRRLSLETPERKVRFVSPNSIEVTLKRPTRATKMIEELMVLCNECAAQAVDRAGAPTLYRVHPLPDRGAVERFNGSCAALGLELTIPTGWLEGVQTGHDDADAGDVEDGLLKALLVGGKLTLGALSASGPHKDDDEDDKGFPQGPILLAPDPKVLDGAVDAFNSALLNIKELTDVSTADLLSIRLLRVLPRALYSDRNIGHFGLRSMRYCHFTSPIRRYADVLVHRTIKWLLARDGKGPEVPWDAPSTEEVASMMENINEKSQSAEEWEREMVNVALATRAAMDPSFRGAVRTARLVSLIPSAAFFLLDDGVTEGRIPFSRLSPFRLTLDPTESILVMDPEQTDTVRERAKGALKALEDGDTTFMKLGDRIGCSIGDVSIAEGRVDLVMTQRGGLR